MACPLLVQSRGLLLGRRRGLSSEKPQTRRNGHEQQTLEAFPRVCMAPVSILFALVALLPGLETSEYCAHFEFPDLPGQTVTATEDSYVTIPFRLVFEPFTPHQATSTTTTTTIATSTGSKSKKCLRKEAFVVLVTRAGKGQHSSRPPMDYCVLRVSRGGHCLSFSRQRRCVCHGGRRIWEEAAKGGGGEGGGDGGGGGGGGDGDGGSASGGGGGLALLFTRKVRREDEGWWWWWTQEGVAAPAEVFLKVSDHIATTVTTAATTATTTTNNNNTTTTNTATTTSNIINNNNNRSSSSRIKAEKLDADTQEADQSAYNNADEDEEDSDDDSEAAVVNVSHIAAMVAGVNLFTIIIIGIVVLAVRHLRCCKRGRGRPRPAPPLCQRKATGERRHYDVAAVSSAGEKRSSTSSRLYDEISDDVTTLINSDTSLYLHPISGKTDTPAVPVITFAAITNAK